MEFTEKLMNYSNKELLRIINNPDEYQQAVVEKARIIFLNRELNDEEINKAKSELEIEKIEVFQREFNKWKVVEKYKKIIHSLYEKINPIQKSNLTTDKKIRIICILFSCIFIIRLSNEFELISSFFTVNFESVDFSLFLYVITLLIVPTFTILFYKKQRYGWLLIVSYLTYSTISAIGFAILEMNTLDINLLPSVFLRISIVTYLLSFVIYASLLWTICQSQIRYVYKIKKETMYLTISTIAAVVILGMYAIF